MSTQILTLPKLELKLDKQQINSLIQQYLQQCYESDSIRERAEIIIQRKVDKEINRMINNGELVNKIASKIAKKIPLSEIVSLINTDELNKVIQERVSNHIIDKL